MDHRSIIDELIRVECPIQCKHELEQYTSRPDFGAIVARLLRDSSGNVRHNFVDIASLLEVKDLQSFMKRDNEYKSPFLYEILLPYTTEIPEIIEMQSIVEQESINEFKESSKLANRVKWSLIISPDACSSSLNKLKPMWFINNYWRGFDDDNDFNGRLIFRIHIFTDVKLICTNIMIDNLYNKYIVKIINSSSDHEMKKYRIRLEKKQHALLKRLNDYSFFIEKTIVASVWVLLQKQLPMDIIRNIIVPKIIDNAYWKLIRENAPDIPDWFNDTYDRYLYEQKIKLKSKIQKLKHNRTKKS